MLTKTCIERVISKARYDEEITLYINNQEIVFEIKKGQNALIIADDSKFILGEVLSVNDYNNTIILRELSARPTRTFLFQDAQRDSLLELQKFRKKAMFEYIPTVKDHLGELTECGGEITAINHAEESTLI